jgi:hypothetical protein
MRALILSLAALLPACVRYHPPAPPEPRAASDIAASFGHAWDAVVDVFAEANTPIRTMERASGFIAAELATIPVYTPAQRDFAHSLADCGYRGQSVYVPTSAFYNIVVRGDSSRATVKVTVRYLSQNGATTLAPVSSVGMLVDCSTRGVLENLRESEIRTRAEQTAPRVANSATAPPTSSEPRAAGSQSVAPNAGIRPMNVVIRFRFVDPDSSVTVVPDLPVAVVSEQGDTTYARTNGLGVIALALPPGRYRLRPEKPVDFEGRRYEWEGAFAVRMGMGPVDFTQRNARVSTTPR